MRVFVTIGLFGSGLLFGSAAMLSAQQATLATAEKTATTAKPKLICHNETVTGSLAARQRKCLTAAQRKDMSTRARDEMSMYGGGRFSCSGGNTPNC